MCNGWPHGHLDAISRPLVDRLIAGGWIVVKDKVSDRRDGDSIPEAAKKQSATRLDELNKTRGKRVFHDLERGPENKS